MDLKGRGLPPAMVIAGLVMMHEVARRWSGWLDKPLLQLLDDLACVGRAAIASTDRRCPAAFMSLHGEQIAQAQQAVALRIMARIEAAETSREAIYAAIAEFGWSRADLERFAAHARGEGEPAGQALALEDEADVFDREEHKPGGTDFTTGRTPGSGES